MQILRQAVRSLWRDRAFSVVAVTMVGLGVGLTTAIFAVLYTVLLQSPYPAADRLYALEQVVPDLVERYPTAEFPINARHLDEWRNSCAACESLGLLGAFGGSNLTGDGAPERLPASDARSRAGFGQNHCRQRR